MDGDWFLGQRGKQTDDLTTLRKLEHILVAFRDKVEAGNTLLEEVYLVHQALPETDLSKIDTSVKFLGKTLSMPLMITGMTGGHPFSGEINRLLARAASKHQIAIGVGSQRAALRDGSLAWTYQVVREEAPNVPVIANIGAPQLVRGDPIHTAEKAIEMIEADGLAVHLNPGQEAFQPEGDVDYRGVLRSLRLLVDRLDVPVIVKETGSGISMQVAEKLRDIGVRYIDVSGAGGTNWIKVEMFRARIKKARLLEEAGKTFSSWGIPTALSIVETRWAHRDAIIIASGGVRDGLDIAKSIALGADIAGMALPMLRAVLVSEEELDHFIKKISYEIRAALYLTASGNVKSLQKTRPVLGPSIMSWLKQRGIDYEEYFNILKSLKPLESRDMWRDGK